MTSKRHKLVNWFIKYVVTITMKKGVYVQLIRSTADDIFEGGNTVPHKNVYIRKTNLN